MKKINIIWQLGLSLSILVCITACNKDENTDEIVEKQDIDLGLPSGTLWTNCNLGANNPWGYGDYYAWGEISTKQEYYWGTYKYCNGSIGTLTKYCTSDLHGKDRYCDTLTILQSSDDAATVILGTQYSIPTETDWNELNAQCYWVWTESYNNRNISGYIVYKAKSASDKGVKVYINKRPSDSYTLSDTHIFLPCGGFYKNSILQRSRGFGYYWSSSLNYYYVNYAFYCYFFAEKIYPSSYEDGDRCYGLSIRPVRHK